MSCWVVIAALFEELGLMPRFKRSGGIPGSQGILHVMEGWKHGSKQDRECQSTVITLESRLRVAK